ncbi:MAG: TetR/AcrR family transcriptional regulator [Jatrophihabitantaceae bacterium]
MPHHRTLNRPQRRDAIRNRAALIQAAREVFAARGFEASMDDIAHHAGLGVGTAYRHFANKYVLADAIFDEAVEAFVGAADRALTEDDAWTALVGLVESTLEAQTNNRGIREILLGVHQDDPEHHRSMTEAFVRPFERAKAAGAIRPDAEVSDLGAVLAMLCTIADATAARSPQLWRRYLPTMLAGLRPGGPPMPETPLVSQADDDLLTG